MLGDNIRRIRMLNKISINKLSKLSGISLGYLSDLENNKAKNPTTEKLKAIADILNVPVEDFFKEYSEPKSDIVRKRIEQEKKYTEQLKEKETEFKTAEAAMKFILEQPAIAAYGGFDVNKMSDEEIMDFANELLNQLKLLGFKYKK